MAKKTNEHRLEEVKAHITEIVSTMSLSEMEKLLKGLQKWHESKLGGKREHARKDLSIYARFWLGDYLFEDYITNISGGGLFLETKIPATVGGTVKISFVPSDDEDPIEVKGEIVRVTPNGFGVKFNESLTAL
jgi:hypothetical protein